MTIRESAARTWVMSQAAGTYFTTADVPGTRAAVDTALSRLATPDGPIQRVRQGVYWRKPIRTRFGSAKPDPMQVALVTAGAGAGPAGASAANALGLTTQVPRRAHIAVIGRAPQGIPNVRITGRANAHRLRLNSAEVAVLEALRDFDKYAEISWERARRQIMKLAESGVISLHNVSTAAKYERSAAVRRRIDDLIQQ